MHTQRWDWFLIEWSPLQRMTTRTEGQSDPEANDAAAEMRNRIIKRAALEFHDGIYGILSICGILRDCLIVVLQKLQFIDILQVYFTSTVYRYYSYRCIHVLH